MYADGVSMENIIKWADADENLVKAVIAEYEESRAQKKYMNERMPICQIAYAEYFDRLAFFVYLIHWH